MTANPTPNPAPPPPPPKSGSGKAKLGCAIVLALFIVVAGLIALGTAVVAYLFWDDMVELVETLEPYDGDPDFRWSSLAHGVDVREGDIPGQLAFTLDGTLERFWRPAENPLLVPADGVPADPAAAAAASDALARAIRDRDDAGAVFQTLMLSAAEPSLRDFARFHVRDAIVQGRTDLVLGMIHADLPFGQVDPNGNGPLHSAAMHNRVEVLEALLDTGRFDPSEENLLKQTPLDVAVEAGADRAAELLRTR